MITSRRDYLLRIIDEVGRLLARVMLKRRAGDSGEALRTVVQACERLFSLEADQLFQFTPDQHYAMLIADSDPIIGRNKVLLYAALNAEAGQIYAKLGNDAMRRASFLNALRLTLRAQRQFPNDDLPPYAPSIPVLRANLEDEPLDPETEAMIAEAPRP